MKLKSIRETLFILTLTSAIFIGLSQCITAQIKTEFDCMTGLQLNKRFNGQGLSFGVNAGFNLARLNRDSTYIHQSFLININHHINSKSLRSVNSQSLELHYYPGFGNTAYPLIGIGIEGRHYDFSEYTLSPKLNINLILVSVYVQRNYIISSRSSIQSPKITLGMTFNTTLLIGSIERVFYKTNFPMM